MGHLMSLAWGFPLPICNQSVTSVMLTIFYSIKGAIFPTSEN